MSSYGSRWQMDWTISRLHEFPRTCFRNFISHLLPTSFGFIFSKITFDLKQKSLLTYLHKWELSKIKERSKENSIQQKSKPTLPKVVMLVQVSLCIKMKTKTTKVEVANFWNTFLLGTNIYSWWGRISKQKTHNPQGKPHPKNLQPGKTTPKAEFLQTLLGWGVQAVAACLENGATICAGEAERFSWGKRTNVPWKSMVGRCISSWNGDMLFWGVVFIRGAWWIELAIRR